MIEQVRSKFHCPLARLSLRRTVVVLLFSGLLGWLFLLLADEVAEREFRNFDETVLLRMRTPEDFADPIGPLWLEETARDLTALGSVSILSLVVLVTVVLLLLKGKPRVAYCLLFSVAMGTALSFCLKNVFDRPRPELVTHKMHTLTRSFPSGHALLSSLVYLSVGAIVSITQPRRLVKTFIVGMAFAIAFVVGMTRLYLGVHWPTDVIGGWLLGTAWAALWWLMVSVFLCDGSREARTRVSVLEGSSAGKDLTQGRTEEQV